ncbi:glycosyltransferase 87 family protein [Spongiactinospora sp. TRM90649]|uniref:glycosyltransferase family 87 protein n=1 Tax=Spongiactinospora sp. TRM90649 TaxID=3031114 RepID=UPI0023F67A77|nr:glycosyltransferase 87 family protein [Spongiactinospora sp. TRM90649]MDF5756140.1 glycosyltransferase 87 family protein [Spongiactinospora sp. TRM90649]
MTTEDEPKRNEPQQTPSAPPTPVNPTDTETRPPEEDTPAEAVTDSPDEAVDSPDEDGDRPARAASVDGEGFRAAGFVTGVSARALPYMPLAVVAVLGAMFAYLWKWPCRFGGAWNNGTLQFTNFCYTDIYPLYFDRGLSDGKVPYFADVDFEKQVEYPVVLGWVMHAVSRSAALLAEVASRAATFYDLTVLLMAACLVAGVLMMARLAGPGRRWDALWYAIAPGVVLAAYINWDLAAGALSLGAMLAWARQRQVLAGVLLGLAIATKFYPLMFVGALFLLALRTFQWAPFLRTMAAAAVTWIVVNVPIMIFAFDGWRRFYVFSQERGADWGSLWFFFQQKGWPLLGDPDRLSFLGIASLGTLCLLIAVLALTAPTRPRLMQLCFLALAAFMLTNKVWSPQFVLWLVPFAVLARPNWKPLALWQVAEVWYFFAIWLYLVGLQEGNAHLGITGDTYYTAVWGRALTIVLMMALVVRDILRPERDLVRQGGVDDQAGGVFDGAPDRLRSALAGVGASASAGAGAGSGSGARTT